ncbi:MAG: ferritin family protein [Candidatus Acetothermia bacterium]
MESELRSFALDELIGHSIESEEASRRFYSQFVEAGIGRLVTERFEGLMTDEELHKEVLLGLHEDLYGDRDYLTPESDDLPPHEDFESLEDVENLIDALEKAMINENNAIRVYEYLSEEYEEYSEVFGYLAAMEHGHYESLKQEKKLYERVPGDEESGTGDSHFWKWLGLEGI